MNFLQLPSGQFVNVSQISRIEEEPKARTAMVWFGGADNPVKYPAADALVLFLLVKRISTNKSGIL